MRHRDAALRESQRCLVIFKLKRDILIWREDVWSAGEAVSLEVTVKGYKHVYALFKQTFEPLMSNRLIKSLYGNHFLGFVFLWNQHLATLFPMKDASHFISSFHNILIIMFFSFKIFQPINAPQAQSQGLFVYPNLSKRTQILWSVVFSFSLILPYDAG